MCYANVDLKYFDLKNLFASTLETEISIPYLLQINQDVESNAGMPPQTIHYNLTGVPCQKFNLGAARRASSSGDNASLERVG
jgi:hypothetical protein